MVDFGAVIGSLISIGFYSVVLPFILVYVIVFGILEKSKIFSKNDEDTQSKNINAIIAFVFGLFVVASIKTVQYIQSLILNIVLFIIFILVVLMLLGFIFGDEYVQLFRNASGKVSGKVVWAITIIVFLIALFVLFKILGIWAWFLSFFSGFGSSSTTDWATYFFIGLMAIIIYFVSKGDSGSGKKKDSSED